jgi:type II secretory pathway pseudopilin PulG
MKWGSVHKQTIEKSQFREIPACKAARFRKSKNRPAKTLLLLAAQMLMGLGDANRARVWNLDVHSAGVRQGSGVRLQTVSVMQTNLHPGLGREAFTLVEMVVCFAIMGLVIGGTINAYVNSGLFAERAGYELAAQAQAVQVMERARAASWDTQVIPAVDYTTNLPAVTTSFLELPISGTNVVVCTNYFSVVNITNDTSLGVVIKMFQVTTIWPWRGVTMTNTIVTYRAPDA